MRFRLALALGAFALVSGCGYRRSPVAMVGHPASLAQIAGEWNGTYAGTDTRRVGRIWFSLAADADSAFGEVRMEELEPMVVVAADDPLRRTAQGRAPQFLAIRFVAVLNGEVGGQLEPYRAPDCACTVVTYFHGRLVGDTISGAFQTQLPGNAIQSGTWRVIRSKPE